MAVSTKDARQRQARAFIDKLETLQQANARREISSLKRNAGNTLTEARNGVNWFYRLLEGDDWSAQEDYFLVATLWALNPLRTEGNFGRSCHELWLKKKFPKDTDKDKANSAVARRFNILLDADHDGGELAFRLRQFVKLLASQQVGIDWIQLLLDLRDWRYTQKRIQRQWAQSFYAPGFTGDSEAIANSAEGADTIKGDSHVD